MANKITISDMKGMDLRPAFEKLEYAGIVAGIIFWVLTVLSILINPWFMYFIDAFSDLGGPNANNPFVYNYGLIITAVIAFAYSMYILDISRNKVQALGSSFFSVATIFLALIGIFHEGYSYHGFVSVWFFFQSGLAITVWGLGLWLNKDKQLGVVVFLMGIIGTILGFTLPWPSAAVAESYGVILIDIWALIMFKVCRDYQKLGKKLSS